MKTNKKPFKVLSAVVLQAFVLWTAGCGLSIPSDLTDTKNDDNKTTTDGAASKATSGQILEATWDGIESALQANPSMSRKFQLKRGLELDDEEEGEEEEDADIQPDFDYTCELNYSAQYGSDEEASEQMDVTCQSACANGDEGNVTVSMSTDGSTTEFTVEFSDCEIVTCSDDRAVISGSGRVTINDSCEADFDLDLSIAGEGDVSFDLQVEMAGSGDVCTEVDSCRDYAGSILYGSDSLATADVCGTMEEDLDEVCGGDEPDCESEEEDGCGDEPTPEPEADECSEETVSCSANFECQLFAEDNQSDDYETGNVACVEGCCEIVDREDTNWMDNLDDEDESESEDGYEDDYDYWF